MLTIGTVIDKLEIYVVYFDIHNVVGLVLGFGTL